MSVKQSKLYLFLIPLAILFVALSIKIAGFSLDSSEVFLLEGLNKTITAIDGKTQIFSAVQEARGRQGSVFVSVVTQVVNQVAKGSPLVLRLPGSLVFPLSLIVFYLVLKNLKVRRSALWLALPLTNYLLWHFAGKLSYEIWFALFALVGFWAGFQFFLKDSTDDKFWSGFALALSFLVLPTIHFFAVFHILIFDLAFLTIFLWLKKDWLRRTGELLLLNLLLLVPLSVWADVTISYFKKLSLTNLAPLREILYRLSGDNRLLAWVVGAGLIAVFITGAKKLWRKREVASSPDVYFALNVFYLLYLSVAAIAWPIFKSSLEDNYLFLIWPLFLALALGVNYLPVENRRVALGLKIVIFGLALSNIVNLIAFLGSGGFDNWKVLAESIKQTGKTRVVTNNNQWLKGGEFYWRKNKLKIDEIHRHEELEAEIGKGANNIVIVYIPDKTPLSKDIERLANEHFGRRLSPWGGGATRILLARQLNPDLKSPHLTQETAPVVFFER